MIEAAGPMKYINESEVNIDLFHLHIHNKMTSTLLLLLVVWSKYSFAQSIAGGLLNMKFVGITCDALLDSVLNYSLFGS